MGLSIRWRLTLWNTLGLAVVLLGFGALVYGLMARALYQQIDNRLLAQFELLSADTRLASEPDQRLHHWIEEFEEHARIFCVAYDSTGTARDRTDKLAEESIPPAPPMPAQARFENLTLPYIERQRALITPLRAGDREFTVVLMAPL